MTYNEFLTSFTQDFLIVLNWIKTNLFIRLNDMFTNYLVFTLIGISFILFVIEEIVGVITSFRFGGFIFRHFRIFYPRPFEVSEKFPDYSKESRVRPFRPFYRAFYRQKYSGKYFINYNGRYYPTSMPRFNPFAISKFNAEYRAGNIISYSQLYKSSVNSSYTSNNISGIAKRMYKTGNKLPLDKILDKGEELNSYLNGSQDYGISEDTDLFEGLDDKLSSSLDGDNGYTLNGLPAIKNSNGFLSYNWDEISDDDY